MSDAKLWNDYVKLEKDCKILAFEVSRLRDELAKANASSERFERLWYLKCQEADGHTSDGGGSHGA